MASNPPDRPVAGGYREIHDLVVQARRTRAESQRLERDYLRLVGAGLSPDPADDDFADRMLRYRTENALSQDELGKLTAFTKRTIGRWERRENHPTKRNVRQLAQRTRMPLAYWTKPFLSAAVMILIMLTTVCLALALAGQCPLRGLHLCPM